MYNYLILTQIIFSVAVFCGLLFFPAPYGRYSRKYTSNMHKFSLSARKGWLIMELPATLTMPIICALYYKQAMAREDFLWWGALLFVLIWEFHYLYRGIIYPLLLSNTKYNMPIYIALSGSVFNILNGYLNAWAIIALKQYHVEEFKSFHFILGIILFFFGFFIHSYSDRAMRIEKRTRKGYFIPQKFPYTLISSPNYLGELLQWTGWALASWTLAGTTFALFTCANLLPRALAHLKWYKKTFPDYPKRKAFIPFLL